MDLGRFFLYYGLVLQIILSLFLFNTKLEWALLISLFYIIILFLFGFASEIPAPAPNGFIDAFNGSRVVTNIHTFIKDIAKKDATPYMKYLILLPSIMNLISVKLLTNYDRNKKIHKSKSKLKTLDAAKILLCIHVFLLAIVVFFGFYMPTIIPQIMPLGALGLLYLISIAGLITSIFIHISY
jgi:hypothetical protein